MSGTFRRATAGGLVAAALLATTPALASAQSHPTVVQVTAHPSDALVATTRGELPTASIRAASRTMPRPVLRRWWGTEIVIGSRTVRHVTKVISMGAGAAGVVAVLAATGVISSPAAIPGGVAAAVLTLGRAALALCNWQNRGIRILIPRMAPVATCLPR